MTANGHRDLPGEQRNAYADNVTGSGQKTATGQAESNPGLPENESARVESGSGQKAATRPHTGRDRLRCSRPLDREREEERERERRPRELLNRARALLSFCAPRSEDWEPREDNTQERSSEVSLNSPRRRVCGEEWGETTEEAERAREVRCDRQSRDTPTPLVGPRSSRRGGSPPGHNTRCTPRPLPLPLPT